MKNKETITEIIFNSDKFVWTKKGLSILFILLFFILQVFDTQKLIMEGVIQLVLIILFLHIIGKIMYYNKKNHKETTLTDKILLIGTVILLSYNTFSLFS
ncbi:hypothetical protein [Neobacillus jeddahensis]|uniref:hypothetical protein n=1 Tax=Neobacillus jeddahensis TaxID=1461580 RepID=UPI00058CE314|nr:hypothetical protein [Neobacillus jeddahensis]